MKTQDNSYWIEVYPEDNSDYDKRTIGGVRIEIEDDCDKKTIPNVPLIDNFRLIFQQGNSIVSFFRNQLDILCKNLKRLSALLRIIGNTLCGLILNIHAKRVSGLVLNLPTKKSLGQLLPALLLAILGGCK